MKKKNNTKKNYLPLYISMFTGVGAVFGSGVSVVLDKIWILPLGIVLGLIMGTLFGNMINKVYKIK